MTVLDPDQPRSDAHQHPGGDRSDGVVAGVGRSDTHELDPDDYGRTGEPGERAEIGKPYLKPWRLAIVLGLLGLLATRGWAAVAMVVGIIVMIFLHELGHYVMARRAGMKVTEFMIGFGPRIFSFRRGDVEYGLKAIPAGAYVKIIGMANVEEVPPADEPVTYRQKGYWARMGVAVAGSTMHFLIALLLIGATFVFVGRQSDTRWAVDSIAPGSAAAAAGVREGDRVVRMDGVRVDTHAEMAAEAQKRPGEDIAVEVVRDGRAVQLDAAITARFLVYGTNGSEFQVFGNGDGTLSVSVPEESPLADAGLRDGDVIDSIGGAEVATIDEARRALRSAAIADTGRAELGVTHADGRTADVTIDTGTALATSAPQGFFGVGQELVPEKLGPLEAVPATFGYFGEVTVASVKGLGQFFQPSNLFDFAERVVTTSPGGEREETRPTTNQAASQASQERDSKRMMSIVGAVLFGEQTAEADWTSLLMVFALLNMAIGIINLVPLPPFDGGHVAIGTYEKIRELLRRDGRRYFADYNKLMPLAVAVVSVMLIVGLMALYLDLADPVRV